ncbi:gastrula zinc finger protein XlCGF57.1-like [Plodia interpunctella]|uniref:gastrula zinc finger protein XlCGF57.1-like n=1 Tax=Plodia interpunctella TaxID=58824 RepID=UPI002368B5D4|nr:gastrula zinc finger protein XlCGF57.1-like isoform X2 [Plodia interpunctella]
MPDAVAACRVCLAGDVRLLTIAGALQLVYEKITSNALHSEGKPVAACYICYAQLDKCRKLMLTCALAENVLNNMLHRHTEITTEAISLIDCKAQGLRGSLTCSGAVHHNSDIHTPVEIKTELESDVATFEPIRPKEEPEEGADIGSKIAITPKLDNMCDIKYECDWDEGDPLGLLQRRDKEMDTLGHGERGLGVASAQTSGAGERRQAKGSTAHRSQRGSRRDSTTGTAQLRHQCDACQKRFRRQSAMKIRYMKPFQCELCDYRCNRKPNLLNHMRTHTGVKPFKCNVCEHRFTAKRSLSNHIITHTGEKPFQCDICDFRCNRKSNLSTHIIIHISEKRFYCIICDYRCNRKSNLSKHLRTHTDEKPFQCKICDYRCKLKGHLLRHIKTHTGEKPHQCNVCDYRCIDKSTLLSHIRTHTGEKAFRCNICDYCCTQKSKLTRHVNTHTAEKVFQCGVSDYSSKLKSNLLRHIRTHTGEEPKDSTRAESCPSQRDQ